MEKSEEQKLKESLLSHYQGTKDIYIGFLQICESIVKLGYKPTEWIEEFEKEKVKRDIKK